MNILTEEQAKDIIKIAEHYGLKSQLEKLMEECVELAAAAHTLSRNPADDYYSVVDEIVDVKVMIKQILHLLPLKSEKVYADFASKSQLNETICKPDNLESVLDGLMTFCVVLGEEAFRSSIQKNEDYNWLAVKMINVELCINQLMRLLPPASDELFKRRLDYKIDRQIKRIESEGNK